MKCRWSNRQNGQEQAAESFFDGFLSGRRIRNRYSVGLVVSFEARTPVFSATYSVDSFDGRKFVSSTRLREQLFCAGAG